MFVATLGALCKEFSRLAKARVSSKAAAAGRLFSAANSQQLSASTMARAAVPEAFPAPAAQRHCRRALLQGSELWGVGPGCGRAGAHITRFGVRLGAGWKVEANRSLVLPAIPPLFVCAAEHRRPPSAAAAARRRRPPQTDKYSSRAHCSTATIAASTSLLSNRDAALAQRLDHQTHSRPPSRARGISASARALAGQPPAAPCRPRGSSTSAGRRT